MAYTLTQARPLLNAAELELFGQSRAEPIKALTPKSLAGKVTRARTLRDKYRDLYRRQTVALRGEDAVGRSANATDNERTQRKADIFQEVLERFEARTTLLHARSEREAARSPSQAGADKKAASTARTKPAAPAAKKAARRTSAPAKRVDDTADASEVNAPPTKAGAAPARSDKAPSRKAPTSGDKAQAPQVNAPLDSVASAQRASPLKQDPGNIAIHAHQSSSARRTQGKRDSR